ncbi:ATP-dependent DNA helicase [Fusarium oxysporum f. sp. albedinis]|nr:ATP-dependent DNA helicase [Fusarium oxysporum f. sp. albedinis]
MKGVKSQARGENPGKLLRSRLGKTRGKTMNQLGVRLVIHIADATLPSQRYRDRGLRKALTGSRKDRSLRRLHNLKSSAMEQ